MQRAYTTLTPMRVRYSLLLMQRVTRTAQCSNPIGKRCRVKLRPSADVCQPSSVSTTSRARAAETILDLCVAGKRTCFAPC